MMKKHRKDSKISKLFNLKKIRKILFSKSFLGSMFFAFALWVYTALNYEYKTFIDMPLKIILPKNIALETELPEKISVKVKGSGWNIFYLNYFSTSANCTVNLSDKVMSEGYYQITRNEIIKGVESFTNIEPIDVLPEILEITTGLIERKKVPVIVKIKVNPRFGFIQVGNFAASPDSIIITGNSRVIKKLNHWETVQTQFSDLFQNHTVSVNLKDSLKNIITLSQNTVNVKFDIQQSAEFVIKDLKVNIRGIEKLPQNQLLLPDKISITIRGGVEQLSDFSPSMISSYIDYRDILSDTSGIIIPNVNVTNNLFHIVGINPPYLYHKKIIN